MRKHLDVIAILFLGAVLLVSAGVRAAAERMQSQTFRVRQLVTDEVLRGTRHGASEVKRETREAMESVRREAREGILEVKDALRQSIREISPSLRRY